MVTFLVLAILFGITGATLISSYRADQNHIPTIVFYAITQFIYNLGPNTMIFVLAAEIFPTVYRGTFYGIAAAGGKVGAIIIRAVIGATGNQDMSLGIRLLVFIPVMLLAAIISWFLPDVQYIPETRDTEMAVLEPQLRNGNSQTAEHQAEGGVVVGQTQANDGVDSIEPVAGEVRRDSRGGDDLSSDSSSTNSAERPRSADPKTAKPFGFFSRLHNMTLEEIAPNPTLAKKRRKSSTTTTTPETPTGQARQGGSPGVLSP